MNKTFGYKTFVSLLFTIWWAYLFTHSVLTTGILAGVTVLLTVFFIPLMIFRNGQLRMLSFNPFRKGFRVAYTDVSHAVIHAGNFHCKMTLHLKDGTVLSTSSFFRYFDMEGLYCHLRDVGIPVTSTGVRAVSWAS